MINTNYDESVIHDAVAMCGWKSEEAEMPSDEVVAPSPRDELYCYRYEGCQRLEDYALECQLKKRVRVHTVLFKCAECSYIAAAKKDVARHVRVLHGELAERIWGPKELFVCAVCQKKFTRKDNAQKHYKAQHLP
ncbi:zinc finger protein [Penicillium samsonianum]|uniref:zinc finger protein n=1 Tax=Penicillium samsonianum TaxID=1882272 RepID=UPI0025488719|nr:zinc finger protein [Penicillium samsonianum]KAJ6118446.1 zinc finger protein [Penicillium samsonianum]